MPQPDHGLGPDAEPALAALLDELVPPRPEKGLPGAGGLGIGAALLRSLPGRPELAAVFGPGLAALAALLAEHGAARLSDLAPPDRRALLEALAVRAPAFVPTLAFLTFVAYYQEPRVLVALGREPRPPYPKGYELPSFDEALLAKVRARAPFYRRP
jgi:hypothetical protein